MLICVQRSRKGNLFEMKRLFLIGNIRCGTSLMVRFLNSHPEIHIIHEADIVWLMRYGHTCLEDDSSKGQDYTVEVCGVPTTEHLFPTAVFDKTHERLMRQGSPWLPPEKNKNPKIIGDKKPMQHAILHQWIADNIDDAMFLHVYRDIEPFQKSCLRHPTVKELWGATRAGEIYAKYLTLVFNAYQAKHKIHTIYYSNFCDPEYHRGEVRFLCDFLGVEPDFDFKETIKRKV